MKNRRFQKKSLDSRFRGNDRKKEGDRGKTIRGVLSVNSRAVGFITPEHGEDIRIETDKLNTALNKDEVEVELLRERVRPSSAQGYGRARGQRTGRVVRILRRAKMRFVGTIEEHGTKLVLVPDDFRMYAPIPRTQPRAASSRRCWEPIIL